MKTKLEVRLFIVLAFFLVFFLACEKDSPPKPRGYLRLEYPKAVYSKKNTNCGFYATVNQMARLEKRDASKCWYAINYPKMHAEIFLTHFAVNQDLNSIIKDAQKLTYEHSVKASYIKPKYFENPEKRIFAVVYDVGGNAASNVQFHITDSTKHFVAGSLYFRASPNIDSLKPAIEYLKKDIKVLIETLEWENKS